MPAHDPRMVVVARRGDAAIAALFLVVTNGDLRLHAFTFKDETVKSAAQTALEMLGLSKDQHVNIVALVWDIPKEVSDAQVCERFAATVGANDTAYFYGLVGSLVNSNGGQT